MSYKPGRKADKKCRANLFIAYWVRRGRTHKEAEAKARLFFGELGKGKYIEV